MYGKIYFTKSFKFLIIYLCLLFLFVNNNLLASTKIDSMRIVVLGSSTAEGTGPSNIDNAWVNRFRDYLQDKWENVEVTNLAKGGYSTYHLMPDSYTVPNGRPGQDSGRNVTKAIELKPTAVIINLPSNDASQLYTVEEQLRNYDTICVHLARENIPVWITTTQPRNLSIEGRKNLMAMRDSTFARFSDHAIDFWYGLATEDGYIKTEYNSDNVHMNDEGHRILFERVLNSGAGLPSFNIDLVNPLDSGPFSNSMNIQWSAQIANDLTRQTEIFTSRDFGKNWQSLWTSNGSESSYLWDISGYPDGLFNLLRVIVLGDSGFGKVQTAEPFIIDNPGNSTPEVHSISPTRDDVVTGEVTISWQAIDVENEDMDVNLDLTIDGENWQSIATNIENTGNFIWNTLHLPNSNNYQIKISCTDGEYWAEDTSGYFSVQNQSSLIDNIDHSSGYGGGIVSARIVDDASLTSHQYQLSFDDTSFNYLVYNVDDLTENQRVISNATETSGRTEGPIFDGIRLLIKNYKQAEIDPQKSEWEIGTTKLNIAFTIAEVHTGAEVIRGYAQPSDYRIEISDTIVGNSSNAYGAPQKPLKFTVYNTTEQREVPVIFFDHDNNQTASRLDQIYFVEPDSIGNDRMTWFMYLDGEEDANPPAPGDIYHFCTLKPFSSNDRFIFTTDETGIESSEAEGAVEFKLEQNYPNPFNPTTNISYQLSQPGFVKLNIYNLRGQKVVELVNKNQVVGNYTINFDASELSSGIYFYQLSVGSNIQTRKMLLIR